MINCLKELSNIHLFYGTNKDVLSELTATHNISHIIFNKDTTHYARKRDEDIQQLCSSSGIECIQVQDYNLLDNFDDVQTTTGGYYTVYTPFYNNASKLNVRKPTSSTLTNVYTQKIDSKYSTTLNDMLNEYVKELPKDILLNGGRSEGTKLLHKTKSEQAKYKKTREVASIRTSLLSAHIKFGTLSIREVFHYFKKYKFESLIMQLYWNEFYDYLMYYLPYDRTLGNSNFKEKKIQWENNSEYFKAWKNGKTGFPFIDAGMRQLNSEGYMHNRARMAVANFLSFILLIDWRKGEQYFAQKLIDYDPAQNNGNWQWSVGLGVDKTGYLRIFNPFNQSKNHDISCEYIKKYVPELKYVPNEHIHKWETEHVNYDFCKPIVKYKERRAKAMKIYL